MYPDSADIKRIENWDGTPRELVEFIASLWQYDEIEIRRGRDSLRKLVYKVEFHTIGWSGNEEIIGALRDTFFWVVCWEKSERGGHYYFEIPPNMIDFDGNGIKWGKIPRKAAK